MRSFNRGALDLRPVTLTPGVTRHAEGSTQVEFGDTRVLVTCSVEEQVPPHLMGKGTGWVTAEYGMLPRSTHTRTQREAAKGKQTGRTLEIQRLIGRSMRAAVDLPGAGRRAPSPWTATSSRRTAAPAPPPSPAPTWRWCSRMRKLQRPGRCSRMPKLTPMAAVSVGVVKGEVRVDLDYDEDSTADVDLNLVATGDGRIVEVQGTAEHKLFDRKPLDAMLDAGLAAIRQLTEAQQKVLGG